MGHPGAVLKPCADLLALCDCNNFFVSCERLFRPDLEGRPVVVLSSNDGVVISRSNEIKALGVKMGEPFFRVRSFLNVTAPVFSSNFRLYEEVSAGSWRPSGGYTVHGGLLVDEAFLEIPRRKSPGMGLDVQAAVLRQTGIPFWERLRRRRQRSWRPNGRRSAPNGRVRPPADPWKTSGRSPWNVGDRPPLERFSADGASPRPSACGCPDRLEKYLGIRGSGRRGNSGGYGVFP